MKQYTVLHTIEGGGPGGAETVVLNLATRLDPKRFRSLVLLPKGPWLNRKLKEHEVPIFEVDWHASYDLRGLLSMARIIRRERVDLIHSHLPGQNFYSCVVGSMTHCKTLVTYHGPVELADANNFKGAFKLWFVRRAADGVVVVCDHVGDMLKKLKFPARKIVRIYNGIDPSRFRIGRSRRLHEELGLAGEMKLIGVVANIRQSKGYDFFVRAARRVADHFPEARFLAVGDINPAIAAPIKQLIDELSLQEKFFFIGFREDIPEILSELDVFVLSSTSEGFPFVTLEAMAAGKAMVVTKCGGPEEVVEHGRTGFLVPPSDPDALATKICEVLTDERGASVLGANARAKVNREFTVDAMVNNYARLYERYL